MKRLLVAAALLRERWSNEGPSRILVTRRLKGVHLAGSWEFPGGKVELTESPVDALKRELREELGIEVDVGDIYAVGHHVYPQREIVLLVYESVIKRGTPQRLGVAEFCWLEPSVLVELELPPADGPVVDRLKREVEQCR